MNMKRVRLISLSILLLLGSGISACISNKSSDKLESKDLISYVDPMIGTGGHGHVFVGASVPFGMVQLGPVSIPEAWDWVSGYHISDSTVIGFSHTHFSGTGIGDLLDITIMPTVGNVKVGRGVESDPNSGQWSYSERSKEKVEPGYYRTHLLRYNVDVELTATSRVGLHKYIYASDKSPQKGFIIDLENGGNWDEPTDVYIKKVSPNKLEGYRKSTGWARDQIVYFAIETSATIADTEFIENGEKRNTNKESLKGKHVYAKVFFEDKDLEHNTLFVKVALSPTSEKEAWMNMNSELPNWEFNKVRKEAYDNWNKELSRINISSSDTSVLRSFYTSLYHTMIAPSDYSNVDGSYLGADLKEHSDPGFTTRTTFSLWDTYRALHPLMTLIHPDRMKDIVGTMLNIFKEQGKLPVWHFYANETNTMVGNPGIPVLADAFIKGYAKDTLGVYQALKTTAMMDERGGSYRKEYGYIPYDKMLESVAYDLEYALADWSVAQALKQMDKPSEEVDYFFNRSKSYSKLFDPSTGFMRGLSSAGEWHTPFNPYYSSHREDDYCEGNAWQYTFLVPHDLDGLVNLFGGEDKFVAKLDSLFTVPSEIEGNNSSPDISGMIGQYAHGNEPGHHTIYLYSILGRQDKSAPLLRKVMTTLYNDTPDGISGNEDVGQMSAWYILSALGLYQVEPSGGRYFFGSPLIDNAELKVRDGVFKIIVHNNSNENIYIQSIKLNGKPYSKRWLEFEDIARGGKLDIVMGSTPHKW